MDRFVEAERLFSPGRITDYLFVYNNCRLLLRKRGPKTVATRVRRASAHYQMVTHACNRAATISLAVLVKLWVAGGVVPFCVRVYLRDCFIMVRRLKLSFVWSFRASIQRKVCVYCVNCQNYTRHYYSCVFIDPFI